MPRFYLTTPLKSVTYVLNLLCIRCPEPAPKESAFKRPRGGLDLPRGFVLAASQERGLLLENGRAESLEAVLNK
jgi:hypothetical protein